MIGNGGGAQSHSIALALANGANPAPAAALAGGSQLAIYSNLAFRTASPAVFNGTGTVGGTFDTLDHMYINGVEDGAYMVQGASVGLQTLGNFQLGGSAAGAGANFAFGQYFVGKIYYAAFWSRALTSAEVLAASSYMTQAMALRGVAAFQNAGAANNDEFVAIGDSISAGFGGITPWPLIASPTQINGTWIVNNNAWTGETAAQTLAVGQQGTLPFYRPAAARNVAVLWDGTNDIAASVTAASTFTTYSAYARSVRNFGFKVVATTMVSRGAATDAVRDVFNGYIRQNWPNFADALADVAANVNLGADGAMPNATYFQGDNIHPTQLSHYNIIAPIIERAINRISAPQDFSQATTYVAAALAATATTAGSQSTNTVTITFGATPANCLAGNIITMAGITPAGYNGSFRILTRSATQVTYFTTSGLGVISAQGTGACTQQQDGDVYEILNFGAGNHTLQSCVGYTGQNIYIRNINANPSTLVPFGSETITGIGAASATLAATATAILQSQLVSASAAGCNWVRLQ